MEQVPSDIQKIIERAIREGVGQEYLGIVKELKNTYYLEDVAAAALALYAKQGGQEEQRVQRRTLDNSTPGPFKTPETMEAGERKKSELPPPKPVAFRRETVVQHGHNVHNVQKGHGGQNVAAGQAARTGPPGKGQPRGSQPRSAQSRDNQPRSAQSRDNQPRGSQPRSAQSRDNQPRGSQPRKNQRR